MNGRNVPITEVLPKEQRVQAYKGLSLGSYTRKTSPRTSGFENQQGLSSEELGLYRKQTLLFKDMWKSSYTPSPSAGEVTWKAPGLIVETLLERWEATETPSGDWDPGRRLFFFLSHSTVLIPALASIILKCSFHSNIEGAFPTHQQTHSNHTWLGHAASHARSWPRPPADPQQLRKSEPHNLTTSMPMVSGPATREGPMQPHKKHPRRIYSDDQKEVWCWVP